MLKQFMSKHLDEIKEDSNKFLIEFQENRNQQLDEIRKVIQDRKIKLNQRDTKERQKRMKLEIKISLSQIRNPTDNFANRTDLVKDKDLGSNTRQRNQVI